jgi:hypothetical protein
MPPFRSFVHISNEAFEDIIVPLIAGIENRKPEKRHVNKSRAFPKGLWPNLVVLFTRKSGESRLESNVTAHIYEPITPATLLEVSVLDEARRTEVFGCVFREGRKPSPAATRSRVTDTVFDLRFEIGGMLLPGRAATNNWRNGWERFGRKPVPLGLNLMQLSDEYETKQTVKHGGCKQGIFHGIWELLPPRSEGEEKDESVKLYHFKMWIPEWKMIFRAFLVCPSLLLRTRFLTRMPTANSCSVARTIHLRPLSHLPRPRIRPRIPHPRLPTPRKMDRLRAHPHSHGSGRTAYPRPGHPRTRHVPRQLPTGNGHLRRPARRVVQGRQGTRRG